jgi:hypothetical protein
VPPAYGPTVVLALSRPIGPGDIEGICERALAILAGSAPKRVLCEVGDDVERDAVVVDALARLQLIAKRLGLRIHVRPACPELKGLVRLMGLEEEVPFLSELRVEPVWEPEERKEGLGLEEEADPDDLAP